ncbi:unnamed protein product, partial [Rotaria sordida]
VVIRSLTQTVGLLPLDTHQRVTTKVPIQIKNDNTSFYCRDDISYQMSEKRDTVVIKENGNKISYQKRILLYNIRGAFELFVAENSDVSVARTFFAEIRPPYVLMKSSMSHRVCVCVHHENMKIKIIIIDEITQQHIDLSMKQLQHLFGNTISVKDTKKLHSVVVVVRTDVIECRL